MRVGDGFHLTYCSNIHPGESWAEVSEALATSLPRIRQRLHVEGAMAVGLRLSAQAAEDLDAPGALDRFRGFLRDGNYYVLTMNGFPYGAFHGTRVKERVYLPDWRDPRRLAYTNRLARQLATLLADRPDVEGCVSTVPGAFRAEVTSAGDIEAIASGVLAHAAYLVSLREETGVSIALALEPEPACHLETTDDAVAFFTRYLFNEEAVAGASRAAGVGLTVDDVRRHVGVCLDTCHMAVEFEEPGAAITRLAAEGIRICKVQLSSALRLQAGDESPPFRAMLGRFAEDTYLHQVVQRSAGGITRFTDLPDALAAAEREEPGQDREWRIHFHVPIFLADAGVFQTTQAYLRSVLELLKDQPFCRSLEVETYTWDVLPPEYRTIDTCQAIARELTWVRSIFQ